MGIKDFMISAAREVLLPLKPTLRAVVFYREYS